MGVDAIFRCNFFGKKGAIRLRCNAIAIPARNDLVPFLNLLLLKSCKSTGIALHL